MTRILQAVVLWISSNLDNLSLGFSYGMKRQRRRPRVTDRTVSIVG